MQMITCNLDNVVSGHENVFWFYISVDDALKSNPFMMRSAGQGIPWHVDTEAMTEKDKEYVERPPLPSSSQFAL